MGYAEGHAVNRQGIGPAGLGRGQLRQRRKGDPAKLQIAPRLRKQSTMTLAWIAERVEPRPTSRISSTGERERRRVRVHDTDPGENHGVLHRNRY
jgi:hypothetical protein